MTKFKIDSSKEAIQKTGKAFVIGFPILAGVLFLMHSHISGWTNWDFSQGIAWNGWKWMLGVGVGVYLLSLIAPPIVKPIHIVWMTIAFALGWFNTRLLLGAAFYLVITPTGLLMRLLGKDLLDEKIEPQRVSYWKKRDLSKFDPKHIEKTF